MSRFREQCAFASSLHRLGCSRPSVVLPARCNSPTGSACTLNWLRRCEISMKLFVVIAGFIISLPAIAAADYLGKVAAVAEGDTFTMESGAGKVRIRICGIDAPERGQPGYGQAAGVLSNMIEGKTVEITARFKPVSGKVDEAGGVVARWSDNNNYYVARANALEDNVRFYRVSAGRRQELAGANIRVTPREWHTPTLRAEGDRFTITYDGKSLYTTTDKDLPRRWQGRA